MMKQVVGVLKKLNVITLSEGMNDAMCNAVSGEHPLDWLF
jgi:hypothetical protein